MKKLVSSFLIYLFLCVSPSHAFINYPSKYFPPIASGEVWENFTTTLTSVGDSAYIGSNMLVKTGGRTACFTNNGFSSCTSSNVVVGSNLASSNLYATDTQYISSGSYLSGSAVSSIMYSTNGTTWTTLTSPSSSSGSRLTPASSQYYVATNGTDGIYRSSTINGTYTKVSTITTAVQKVLSYYGLNYLAYGTNAIASSTNGTTWTTLTSPTTNIIKIIHMNLGSVLMNASGQAFFSTDNGSSWSSANQVFSTCSAALNNNSIGQNTTNMLAPAEIVFWTCNGEVAYTKNGTTWKKINIAGGPEIFSPVVNTTHVYLFGKFSSESTYRFFKKAIADLP